MPRYRRGPEGRAYRIGVEVGHFTLGLTCTLAVCAIILWASGA